MNLSLFLVSMATYLLGIAPYNILGTLEAMRRKPTPAENARRYSKEGGTW